MEPSDKLEAVIEGFVADLSDLTRRVAIDAVRSALTMFPDARHAASDFRSRIPTPRKATSTPTVQPTPILSGSMADVSATVAAITPSPLKTFDRAAKTSARGGGSKINVAGPSGKPAKRVAFHPGLIVVPTRDGLPEGGTKAPAIGLDKATGVPAPSPTRSPVERPNRQEQVLEAIRTLVRPTPGEIANHCGLPVMAIHGLLRSSALSSQVAKTATARGIEYSLVSPGDGRPFKRSRSNPQPPPALSSAANAESTPPAGA
jgi:hypothetical protein